MSQRLTDNQLLHRQYLASPAWKGKRQEALAYYGPICNRCKERGTDVHHKTYERVGGAELMEDLEVLCRDCHEAHHRAERACETPKQTGQRSIDRRAIYRYLSASQRQRLIADFTLTNLADLSFKLVHGDNLRLVISAARLLGFNRFHGKTRRKAKHDFGWSNDPTHPRFKPSKPEVSWDERGQWVSLAEFQSQPFSASSSSS